MVATCSLTGGAKGWTARQRLGHVGLEGLAAANHHLQVEPSDRSKTATLNEHPSVADHIRG